MKKICNKDFIIKLMMIFLMIQPILDIKIFYDFEIIGVTIPTIIRLVFFGLLFLIFIIDKKKLKFTILYCVVFLIYSIFHLINASNNYVNSLDNYSILSELIYLIRLAIPMLFILLSYNYKIGFKKITKLFYFLAFIFSLIMIVTNILGISYSSYTHAEKIVGNIFDWPFLSKADYSYYELATKGLFGYANPLSSLFCLILPILLYGFYKEFSLKKFIIIILMLISMLILGTRISSYLSIIILLVMLIVYIVLGCVFKTIRFDKKVFFYNIIMIVITIPIFLVAPINFASDRLMPEEHVEYVLDNNLLDVVLNYKNSLQDNLNLEQKQEIEEFITDNAKYFSINEGIAPYRYMHEDYLEFWLNYFLVSYQNRNNTRDFELYLYNHVFEKNQNKYDILLGFGYSQLFNSGVVLERDGIYHFYTLGMIGLLLFILPYYIILIYSIFKVLIDYKNKVNLENVTYIFVVGMLLVLAIIGGNLFDFFIVNIFLSFICGQLLYNVRNFKKVECLDVKEEKNKIAVSVIVPVYNVEKYIEKCLDSLVNQTLKNIEVIVVNDGSPDNSQKIIDKYKNEYPNIIKSYIKENGGLSDARNFGITKCSGEYIAFLDSDDYVNYDMYEKMYNKAVSKNFDLVVCDLFYVFENSKMKECCSGYHEDLHDKQSIKKTMVDFCPAVWNKLYKKNLFDKNVRFKKSVWFEDVEFIYRLMVYVNSIGAVHEPLINYVQRSGSITKTFDLRLYHYLDNWDGIVDFYKNNGYFDEYKEEIEYSYVRYLFATFIKGLTKINDDKEFEKGVELVIKKVNDNFPNYKKNKYIRRLNTKSLYLRFFNKKIAKFIYKLAQK